MILLDSNVLMYAGGGEHPHRADSLALLDAIARGRVEAAVDVEVLQEVLHRYRAIGRFDLGLAIYETARTILTQFVPVQVEDLDLARDLLRGDPALMARDGLHAAVCLRTGAEAFCSFDRDFDRVPGLRRVEPSFFL